MNLYRYQDTLFTDGVKVMLETYPVIKTTKRGYWIHFGQNKWVSNYSKKRFAYPTREEARVSFVKRKERLICILKHRIDEAREALGQLATINEEQRS